MSQSGYGTVEVRIPVFQRNESIMDNYGGGAAGQNTFDNEMKKMEEEMGKLTGQINEGNKRIASRIVQTTKTTTTRSGGSFGNANQYNQAQAIQHQPQQQQSQQNFQSSHSTTSNQSFNNSGTNQIAIPQDIQSQGGVVETRRTVTTHKTVTHSSSGGNLVEPQVQQSHSTHTQQFSSNNQQNNQQNNQIQWGSPAGSNVQQQQSHHSTTTHSTTGGQQPPGQIQWGSPAGSTVQEQRSSSHHTTTSHSSNQQQNQQSQFDTQNNQELQQWLGDLQSPLIQDRQEISGENSKCLRLRFDVSTYRADEINVKVIDGKLRIHAKHEEKTDNRSAYREFSKEFSLPIGTDPASIKSTLSKEGILTVEAPFPNQLTSQSYLPITY